MQRRRHEINRFLVRGKGRIERRMRTVQERTLSDHKPKMMEVRAGRSRWRVPWSGGGRRRRLSGRLWIDHR